MADTDFNEDDQLNYEAEGADDSGDMDDPELEAIKARVKAMEEEAEKLKKMQTEVDRQLSVPTSPTGSLNLSFEEKMEVDNR